MVILKTSNQQTFCGMEPVFLKKLADGEVYHSFFLQTGHM